MKVVTILGTRPEIIRLSRVTHRLAQYTDHVLVHTGQNADYELNEVFFSDLDVRRPHHFMGIDRSSPGQIIGQVIIESERILAHEEPDAVLLLGDTNSALAAIMARRMKIPIYHMEAGNRCFDLNVPEETNRKIIDHISDFNLVYTEHARRNLLAEGMHPRRIYLSGSPLGEVLKHNAPAISRSTVLRQLSLEPKKYFLVSTHRAENVDNPQHLKTILATLQSLHDEYDLPIIVSTHPRTRERLETSKYAGTHAQVQFLKPFGFHDYIHLQQQALCTLSDSGTISEEAAILDFPAVTMRNAMERPEAMDTGDIVLTGIDHDVILRAVRLAINEPRPEKHRIPVEYEVTDTSLRVLKLICGTARLSHLWDGIAK